MKPLHLLFVAAAATCATALFAGSEVTVTSTTESLSAVARLDALVHLTPAQKGQAEAIFDQQDAALAEARDQNAKAPGAVADWKIVTHTLGQIRGILTPEQLAIYDRTPQMRGGDVMQASPEVRLQMLDREVGLTSAQKPVALQVFKEEYDAVLSLPWDQRSEGGNKYHLAADQEIHALLTPQQLAKQVNDRTTMVTRAQEEMDAAETALRASFRLTAKIGDIMYLENGRRRARMIQGNRSGDAFFKVTGAKSAETVVVSWERVPQTAPVKITKIASTDGEVFGP